MTDSTDLPEDSFPEELIERKQIYITLVAPPLPEPHPAEASQYARFVGIPGHYQAAMSETRFVLVGGGGLNSWVALGLARCGAKSLTIVDPDLVERSNLTRQLFTAEDLCKPKALCLANNLLTHTVEPACITGIALRFEEAVERFILPADIFITGVDRNDCRLRVAQLARERRVPAVFAMLSTDGMRCHVFLQGSDPGDACLWCALPNLDPTAAQPCASAIITSCYFAGALTLFFVLRALMGWPPNISPFNWREADLLGNVPDRTGFVARRPDCSVCSRDDTR